MHLLIGEKLCTMICSRLNFIMPVQNFRGLPQKILEAKNIQNLARFRTNLKFDSECLCSG